MRYTYSMKIDQEFLNKHGLVPVAGIRQYEQLCYAIITERNYNVFRAVTNRFGWLCGTHNKKPFILLVGTMKDNGNLKGYLKEFVRDKVNLNVYYHDSTGKVTFINKNREISFNTDKFLKTCDFYKFGGVLYAMGSSRK